MGRLLDNGSLRVDRDVAKFLAYKDRISRMIEDAYSELPLPLYFYLMAVFERKSDQLFEKVSKGKKGELFQKMIEYGREFAKDWAKEGLSDAIDGCIQCNQRNDCAFYKFILGLESEGAKF